MSAGLSVTIYGGVKSFIEVGQKYLLPDFISFLIHLQFVPDKEIIYRRALRRQHGMIHIDKGRMAVTGHKISDHVVGFFHFRHQPLPVRTGFDRHIYDVDIFQPGPDQVIQSDKTIVYHRSRYRIGYGQVIVTTIDHYLSGMIRENNVSCITDQVRKAGSSKAAIDDRVAGKTTLYVSPLAKRRTPYKKNSPGRRVLQTILPLELRYLIPKRRRLVYDRSQRSRFRV